MFCALNIELIYYINTGIGKDANYEIDDPLHKAGLFNIGKKSLHLKLIIQMAV